MQGILQFGCSGRFSESFEFLFEYFGKLHMATFPVGHHACPNKKDPMAQVLARGTSLQKNNSRGCPFEGECLFVPPLAAFIQKLIVEKCSNS